MPWGPWPDDIATNQLVTSTWLTKVSQSLAFMEEVAYVEFQSDATISGTAVGTANQIVSAGAITLENVPHLIQFDCARFSSGDGALNLILRDSTTVLGTMLAGVASTSEQGISRWRRLTPTAASHTYNIAAWRGGTTNWILRAGAGGAAGDTTTFFPGFIRILKVPT